MSKDKLNLTNTSFENKSVKKGGYCENEYSSSKVLAKGGKSATRPGEYTPESVISKGK